MAGKGYTFLKWNGKYGSGAKFVVKDNSNGKQSLFTPGRLTDMVWVGSDLVAANADWEEFGNETVDNLKDVVF